MIHYRKLEIGEDLQPGDEWPGALGPYIVRAVCAGSHPSNKVDKVGWLRPVVSDPPAPVHRVENETWRIFAHSIMTEKHYTVCTMPQCDYSSDPGGDRIRAKRIVAGQEALKLLENDRTCRCPWSEWIEKRDRILAMLKD